jgi:hypothetical protein
MVATRERDGGALPERNMKRKPPMPAPPQAPELDLAALRQIIDRSGAAALSEAEREKLKLAVDTLNVLTRELESNSTTVARLRRFLFGASEKTAKVLPDPPSEDAPATDQNDAADAEQKPPRKGHGRNGADDYPHAKRVRVPHASLKPGVRCPHCARGNVYGMKEPRQLVRVKGVAPIDATIYECEQLRCNTCGEVYAAPPPEGVGDKKYDESAVAMMAELKYGVGIPFNRSERLQQSLGIPLPAATQWDLVNNAASDLGPVFAELVNQSADGQVQHTDDTSARILKLTQEQRKEELGEDADGRTGTFTSAIVSTREGGHQVALFFTGPRHAGENVAELLKHRAAELPPPILMSDALAANTSGEFEAILSACLVHARRNFVEIANSFPADCRFVLETLRDVFHHDSQARQLNLSPDQRLLHHQKHSQPLMEKLHGWMKEETEERRVEPNSGLGDAIRYMQKHWDRLTLFLRKAGAPLDNNISERALKKAILHRKNALFFRTRNGARVADLFMSIIHTCELNDVSSFDYLHTLLRHLPEVSANPAAWMPWNYSAALGPSPP